MSKKIVIPIVIVLLLIAGGFFWWQKKEIKGSPEDYFIKETTEGKIIENKKAGLIVKVPEGWEAKKIEFLEGSIVLYTQDIEGKKQNEMVSPPLKKGCGIEIAVGYKKMNFDEMEKEIKELHAGLGIKSEEFEVTTINNQQVLKNVFDSVVLGPAIAMYFTHTNKLYSFCLYWALDEKERCIQEFNKFLETISI